MKLQRIFILCLLAFCAINIKAQIGDVILGVFQGKSDTVVVADSARLGDVAKQDSLQVVQLLRRRILKSLAWKQDVCSRT